MVSQLCKYGQIECCMNSQKKKVKDYSFYKIHSIVNVKEELVNDVYRLLRDLNIQPKINVSIQ